MEAEIAILQEKLNKTHTLIESLSKSLSGVSKVSSTAYTTLKPLTSKQAEMLVLERNIQASLKEIASVKDLATDASRYEDILNAEIVDVHTYINSIHKLDDMLEDMNSTEFKGVSQHLYALIGRSEEKMRTYMKEILAVPSLDPQVNIKNKVPFPYFEDDELKSLSLILGYFNGIEKSADSVYVKYRADWITQCMNCLKSDFGHEKGSISLYTEALSGFLANEYAICQDLHYEKVYEIVVGPCLSNFLSLVNAALGQDIGVLSFELYDSLLLIARQLDKKVSPNPAMESAIEKTRALCLSQFKQTLRTIETRVQSISSLPTDIGVSEVTVDIMSRLRKFSEYKDTHVIVGQAVGFWVPQPKPRWMSEFSSVSSRPNLDQSLILSSFFSDCIDALMISLEMKAMAILGKKDKVGYFLLNNMNLVEQIVLRSELQSILGSAGSERLDKLKKRFLSFFLIHWKETASLLMDVTVVGANGKTGSKDDIKAKFKKFNETLDALVLAQKQYKADSELKSLVSQDISSLLLPMYERFYNKYKDFFKNPQKHIKYTPNQLAQVIDSL